MAVRVRVDGREPRWSQLPVRSGIQDRRLAARGRLELPSEAQSQGERRLKGLDQHFLYMQPNVLGSLL